MLKAVNITKEFPGVKALTDVSFEVKENEILALVGENGAGKSTLMKVLSGVYAKGTFTGQIFFDSTEVNFENIKDAEKMGIAIIHQELNLIPELSVAENIYLGNLPTRGLLKTINFDKIYSDAKKILRELEIDISPATKVKDLSIGYQQIIEIAKALSKDSKVLLFDEPTSSLSEKEVKILLPLITKLCKEKHKSIIYISHKLDEVMSLSHRVTVLRDGKSVADLQTKNITKEDIITKMVGRELSKIYPDKANNINFKNHSLKVTDLQVFHKDSGKKLLSNINFYAHPGELLGFAGIVGSGRTELMESIFGNNKFETKGLIEVNGENFKLQNVSDSIQARIGLVTEDRKHTGIHLHMSVLENTSLTNLKKYTKLGLIDKKTEEMEVLQFIQELKIKTPNSQMIVGNLSGGNQQKVAIAKWLSINPKILILDEPTRGVDVGAKFEIYSILQALCHKGVSVIVISSELPELIGLCHRVYVMKEGRIRGEVKGIEINEVNLMKLAVG